ncbi:MAG: heme o synthase, partial [Bryobacteraceae bacterium]
AALGLAGGTYVVVAVLLGGTLLAAALHLARERSAVAARMLLRASVLYLPGLYLLLVAGGRPLAS